MQRLSIALAFAGLLAAGSSLCCHATTNAPLPFIATLAASSRPLVEAFTWNSGPSGAASAP